MASGSSKPIGARSTDGGQRVEKGQDLTIEAFADRTPESGTGIGVSFPREHLTLLDNSDNQDDPAGEIE